MKVLLHSDMQNAIQKSGVGRAMLHQQMALKAEGIEYTLDKNEPHDIVHINTVFPQSLIRAKKSKRQGKTVIFHAHSTEEDFRNSFMFSNAVSPLFKQWIKQCYSTSDLILTPSQYSKELLTNYSMNPPIEVISNGIDLKFWRTSKNETSFFKQKYQKNPSKKLIIAVGLPIKRKGILDFVELAKRMPEYEFIWFGYSNPKFLPKEVKEAWETNLPNLTFAGYVERDTLRVAYRASDLYLFLTHEETEGIVLLEALASKTNVLVRDIPVFGPPMIDGKNIYKASTIGEFESKIRNILGGNLPSLAYRGYKIAQKRSIENVGRQLRFYYEEAYKLNNK